MKKLFSWLLAGITATVISISLKSNLLILISMALLLMIPVFFITLRLAKRNYEQSLEKKVTVLSVHTENKDFQYEQKLRERMRTEANQLQAEFARIKKIESEYERIYRLAAWQLKSDVHHQQFSDLYEHIGDYSDQVTSNLKDIDALKRK